VWHLPLKITEIPPCTTLNQGWVLDFRARVKTAESFPKTLYNLWYVICTIYGLEKGPLIPVCSRYIKKGLLYFTHATQKNFSRWKQFKFIILSANLPLRESPFHIVNCLKLFDFTLFFVYTLKLLKDPLWHFSVLLWKTYDLLQSLRLQSGSSALKQNNAKTKCESLKEEPRDISEKRGPRDDSLGRLP